MTVPSRLILLSQILVVIGGLAFIVGTFPVDQVTFDVSAETDVVQYEPAQDPSQRYSWVLDSAEYSETPLEEPSPIRTVSGTLHFSPPVIVTVSRRSSGPVNIRLDVPPYRTPGTVGMLDIGDSLPPVRLEAGALFTLDEVEARAGKGEPVVLPVFGTLTIGSGALNDGAHPPGVRSGTVELLSSAVFKDTSILSVRSMTLRPADTFRMSEGDGPGYGLLVADERPLVQVAYRALGTEARIERLHGQTRLISASKSDVWRSDPLFQAVAAFVLILVTLAIGSVRVWVRGLRAKHTQEIERDATHV